MCKHSTQRTKNFFNKAHGEHRRRHLNSRFVSIKTLTHSSRFYPKVNRKTKGKGAFVGLHSIGFGLNATSNLDVLAVLILQPLIIGVKHVLNEYYIFPSS